VIFLKVPRRFHLEHKKPWNYFFQSHFAKMAIFGLFSMIIIIVKFYRDEKGKNKKFWWH